MRFESTPSVPQAKFSPEQLIAKEKEMFSRIAEHSKAWDREIAETATFTPKEIQASFKTEEWRLGDSTIRAVGVLHVPETFLLYRKQIEEAIAGGDVVLNEYAPEAQGLYDVTQADRLRSIPSKFNPAYSVEDLRQALMKYERQINMGSFHHEVELLAAKHGKDMAVADLAHSKDAEDYLQDGALYAHYSEEADEELARRKKLQMGASALAGSLSVIGFLKDVANDKMMSRRGFLKLGAAAVATASVGMAANGIQSPERVAYQNESKARGDGKLPEELYQWRDDALALALKKLSDKGYKKITMIYGVRHLPEVRERLNSLRDVQSRLEEKSDVISQSNSDYFRVYRQINGTNHSEKFTASKDKVWRRVG